MKTMKAAKHRKRLLEYVTLLRDEVCVCMEEGHIKWPPKSLHEVEQDIDGLLREIERTELVK